MKFHATFICVSLILLVATGGAIADDPPPLPKSERAKTLAVPAAPTDVPTLAAPSSSAPDVLLKPKLQPQSVVVTLINDTTISGTISEADQWTMKTSFGTANLPLSAVAGIRMAQEGTATTTVALHNGDIITGGLEINHVVVQTDWGRAEILGTHVASILFTTGLKWTSEAGLNGTRWKLVATDSRPATSNSNTPTVATQPRGMNTNRPRIRP